MYNIGTVIVIIFMQGSVCTSPAAFRGNSGTTLPSAAAARGTAGALRGASPECRKHFRCHRGQVRIAYG